MSKGFTAPFVAELAPVFLAILVFVAVFFAVGLGKTMIISADLRLLGILFWRYFGKYRDRWFGSQQVWQALCCRWGCWFCSRGSTAVAEETKAFSVTFHSSSNLFAFEAVGTVWNDNSTWQAALTILLSVSNCSNFHNKLLSNIGTDFRNKMWNNNGGTTFCNLFAKFLQLMQ